MRLPIRVRHAALVIIFAALACGTEPFAPQAAAQNAPLAAYAVWWDEARTCAGGSRSHWDFEEVEWWYVPGSGWPGDETGEWWILGMWDPPKIYIAEAYMHVEWIVKHEMLHAMGFHHADDAESYPWPFVGCAQ